MPANLSADGLRRARRVRAVTAGARFTHGEKLLLLGLNALPLLHLLSLSGVIVLLPVSWPIRLVAGLAWLLLLPPVLSRIALIRPLLHGEVGVPSPTFFRWWATWQLQIVFNRLPWIEESLRFVPGLYSLWLRLWGARIGRLTLWSPGVRVFDRPLLHLGDDVVLGLDTRLVGHFADLDASGRSRFVLGPIKIGDRCTLGAGALLGPGLILGADQATEALFLGTPFTHWHTGQRLSSSSPRPPDSP